MKEVWRSVVGFEGLYEVSDRGRVRSLHKGTSKLKKASRQTTGYWCVWLQSGGRHTVKNKLVSRLVLEAFRGAPPTPKHQAAHRDGNKDDNRLKNLRWATPTQNNRDKVRHGTNLRVVGVAVGRGVLTHHAVDRIRDLRSSGCSHREISEWIGTCLSNVAYVLQRRTWAHV